MKKVISVSLLVGAMAISQVSVGQTKLLRANEMNPDQWSEILKKGSEEVVVEFRQGDEIPVSFAAQGDLLETKEAGISHVHVRKTFWLKLQNKDVVLSLDGITFKPLNQVISGSFTAEASSAQSGSPVNGIGLSLKALLK